MDTNANAGLPSPWWKGLPLLRLLTFVGLTIHLALAFRPGDYILSRPLQEDAFYSLGVARSLAEGHGLTIDGVHPTNGVQPLICFLDAPLFMIAGGDTILALRLVLVLQVLIYAAVVFLVAWFVTSLLRPGGPKREVFWLVAVIVAWSYSLSNGMLNGLETGLAVALAMLAAGYYNTRIAPAQEGRPGRYLLLGAILGVAVLARIDLAFLVAALLLWHLLLAHRRYGSLKGGERLAALLRVLLQCLAVGATSVLVSAPWWIYNYTTFGSLIPISGQAQQMLLPLPSVNLHATALALGNALVPVVHTPVLLYRYSPLLAPILFIAATAAVVLAGRGWKSVCDAAGNWNRFWKYSGILPLLLFSAGLVVYYVFFFGAPHFIVRYLMTLRVLIGVTVTGFLYLIWRSAPAGSLLRSLLVLLLGGSLAASTYALSWNFRDVWGNFYLFPARWIERNVTPPETVGMFQSGTTGFLAPDAVVNLDGKVNAGALRALQEDRLPAYVDSMRFDYLIDWDYFIDRALADSAVRSRYMPVDTLPGDFIVWKRVR